MRRKIFGLLAFVLLVFIVCGYDCINAAEKSSPKEKRETAGTGTKAVKKSKGFASKQEALNDFLDTDSNDHLQHFMTPLGELKLVNRNGKYNYPTEVRLNGNTIFKAQNDPWGVEQRFMVNLFLFPFQHSPGYKVGPGLEKIDRILLEEGTSLDRITQFILLDFTCDKPFVSERFGFNPGLKWHIHLGQVKWGKEKSYIDLDPKEQGRYVYYTCDRIEDITDDEDAKESAQRKKKTQQKQKPANKTHR
jgi:hypothetical protein